MSKLLKERWSRLAFTNTNKGVLNDEASKQQALQEGWNYGGWDGSYGGSVREGSDVMELVGEQLAELGVEAPPEFWSRLNSYINDVERAAKG